MAAAGGGGSGAGSCFVLGASGATGQALLRELRARGLFARVTLIGRRRLSLAEESGTAVVRWGRGVAGGVLEVPAPRSEPAAVPAGAGGGGF